MRKLIIFLVLLSVVPLAAFADVGIGGAAFYKSPVLLGQVPDVANANVDQFSFGGDLRLKLTVFQAEALVLYSAGGVNSLNAYLDAGLAVDVAILRLSLGAGPNFVYSFANKSGAQVGLNAKVGADLMLGPVSVGLSYIMALNLGHGTTIHTSSGLLGVNVLFWQ